MTRSARMSGRWFLVIAYAAFIFFMSSLPRPLPESIQKYLSDWILHGVEYGVFGFLLVRALQGSFEKQSRSFLLITALILGIFYGVSDEWHQRFVPNRHSSARDVAVDGVGVFLGAMVWIKKFHPSKEAKSRHAGN